MYMAGIFGSHPYDRWLESQTNEYLSQGMAYELWWDKLTCNDSFFYIREMEKIGGWLYDKGYTPAAASKIIDRYLKLKQL